jgi:hypothetical protein
MKKSYLEKYPEKVLFWGFAPLLRWRRKRGGLGVRTFTPLAEKKGRFGG